jgi:zinc transporter ZupT
LAGFAAGAMTYVALFELLPEALEETSWLTTASVSSLSFTLMFFIQNVVKGSL